MCSSRFLLSGLLYQVSEAEVDGKTERKRKAAAEVTEVDRKTNSKKISVTSSEIL